MLGGLDRARGVDHLYRAQDQDLRRRKREGLDCAFIRDLFGYGVRARGLCSCGFLDHGSRRLVSCWRRGGFGGDGNVQVGRFVLVRSVGRGVLDGLGTAGRVLGDGLGLVLVLEGEDLGHLVQAGFVCRLAGELFDMGEGGDLQEVAVVLHGDALGLESQADGLQDRHVGGVRGTVEVQHPLSDRGPGGDRCQGDPGELVDEVLQPGALHLRDGPGEDDDLRGGPGVGRAALDPRVLQGSGTVAQGRSVGLGASLEVIKDPPG